MAKRKHGEKTHHILKETLGWRAFKSMWHRKKHMQFNSFSKIPVQKKNKNKNNNSHGVDSSSNAGSRGQQPRRTLISSSSSSSERTDCSMISHSRPRFDSWTCFNSFSRRHLCWFEVHPVKIWALVFDFCAKKEEQKQKPGWHGRCVYLWGDGIESKEFREELNKLLISVRSFFNHGCQTAVKKTKTKHCKSASESRTDAAESVSG